MKTFIVKTLEEEGYSDKSLYDKEARLHTENMMLEEDSVEGL